MTYKQKEEVSLNNLYQPLLKVWNELTEEQKNIINMTGFLYSVSRVNILQAVAQLTAIALELKWDITTIKELLKDETK